MPDFELIQTITAGSTVSSIAVNSIPQNFDILQLVISLKETRNSEGNWLSISTSNGNWNNYLFQHMAPNSGRTLEVLNNNRIYAGQGPGTLNNNWGTMTIDFLNYATSSFSKHAITETGFASSTVATYGAGRQMCVARSTFTTAITAFTVHATENFAAGTMITIYGLKKA